MALELSKVHVSRRDERTGQMVLVRENPYIRFVARERYPLLVQNGVIYTDGGDKVPYKEVPDWFWKEARKVDPTKREKVGLILPEEKPKPVKVEQKTAPKRKRRASKKKDGQNSTNVVED